MKGAMRNLGRKVLEKVVLHLAEGVYNKSTLINYASKNKLP